MTASLSTAEAAPFSRTWARARPHALPLVPGLIAVALMLVWAVHNGGYNTDTWYWGALVVLATLAVVVVATAGQGLSVSRAGVIALSFFAAYVAWSYLSITWAQSKGDALDGSNRALLYLLVFALMAILPWTPQSALIALLTFALGIGVIEVVILVRFARADRVAALVVDGRLEAPTGYFNSTAALFTIAALTATTLAARRELPAALRGALLATAAAGLELAVVGQSRGWLFTLPFVLLASLAVIKDRIRVALIAVIPILALLASLHLLLHVFNPNAGEALDHAAKSAGKAGLITTAAAFVAGTLLAWLGRLIHPPTLTLARRRLLGAVVAVAAVAAVAVGGLAATHDHPVSFVKRQWNGFSSPSKTSDTTSHFDSVGSGRYDFWRVALDAFVAHPIGGLGQDNFADYYITRRRTGEEPSWTHSLELRLLAHTGAVGFALFAGFLIAAMIAALRRRSALGGAALLALVVWLIHGSVDWFWEVPALSGPALGFLGMAVALTSPRAMLARAPAGSAAAAAGSGPAGSGAPAGSASAASAGSVARPPETLPATTPASAPSDQADSEDAVAPPALAPADPSNPDAAAGSAPRPRGPAPTRRRVPRVALALLGTVALVGGVVVLGLPYLAVREVSIANNIGAFDPTKALSDLSTAAKLDPLSANPGRAGGTIALRAGLYATAEDRFTQATQREPGGWFGWLGDGLAASALGDSGRAQYDFTIANSINSQQPVISQALARVNTMHPLTPNEALNMLADD